MLLLWENQLLPIDGIGQDMVYYWYKYLGRRFTICISL